MTRRRTHYDKKMVQVSNFTLNADTLELKAENTVRLSIKEFELLQLLALNFDKSLETDYILERIWSGEPEADTDTVYLYISYLRRKLSGVAADAKIENVNGTAYCLRKG